MNIEPQEFINDVIKAYAKTKLVPATGRMFRMKDGNKCACALGVLYACENNIPEITVSNSFIEVWNWAKGKFGEDFVDIFWRPFDYGPKFRLSDEQSIADIEELAIETHKKVFELYNKGELYG